MGALKELGLSIVDFMGDIEEFHRKFGLEYEGKARMLPTDLFEFRKGFSEEEHREYCLEQTVLEDIAGTNPAYRDMVRFIQALENQLDALVDKVYVDLGTAYMQFGAERFNEAWRRVHAANMAKVRAERAEDSKRGSTFDVVKPSGWKAPDHQDLVADHEPLEQSDES